MKLIITILMAMFISMGSASAQEVAVSFENNDVIGKAYIYCNVSFDDTKVEREEKIHNYTRTVKERAYTLRVDCRQDNSDLISFYGIVKDDEGNQKEFNSLMAGLNWMGMMGWEMLPYPTKYRSDISQYLEYWFRMDVSGLSTDDINAKLAALKPSKE